MKKELTMKLKQLNNEVINEENDNFNDEIDNNNSQEYENHKSICTRQPNKKVPRLLLICSKPRNEYKYKHGSKRI